MMLATRSASEKLLESRSTSLCAAPDAPPVAIGPRVSTRANARPVCGLRLASCALRLGPPDCIDAEAYFASTFLRLRRCSSDSCPLFYKQKDMSTFPCVYALQQDPPGRTGVVLRPAPCVYALRQDPPGRTGAVLRPAPCVYALRQDPPGRTRAVLRPAPCVYALRQDPPWGKGDAAASAACICALRQDPPWARMGGGAFA